MRMKALLSYFTLSARGTKHRAERFFLLALTFSFLFAGCGPGSGRFRLKGEIKKLTSANLSIYPVDMSWGKLDTIKISDGEIAYEQNVSAPTLMRIIFPNLSTLYFVAEPKKTITIEGNATGLRHLRVKGTEDNERLSDFRLEQLKRSKSEQPLAAADFIRRHAASPIAVAAYFLYFVESEAPDLRLVKEMGQLLRKAQPDNLWLGQVSRDFEFSITTATGQTLPDFSAKSLKGETITRAQYAGRPLIILFWASWNPTYPPATRQTNSLRETYGNRIGLLNISLDIDSLQCAAAIARDSVKTPVLCDYRGLASPLVRTFGITTVPGCLVVNAKGQIVAKDVPINEINKHIEQVLK